MIKFKKIILQGFGSYIESTKIKLDRPGLNIVIAQTGGGKTTIFSGIRWVLYGISLKDQKQVGTWLHLQPENWEGTMGHVYFRKGKDKYEVIRCQEYKGKVEGSKGANRLILKINGEPVDNRNKGDVQERINQLLGYTDELFVNAIIFGQGMKRLIDETGPQKKKIFEQAFEAGFINDGKKRAEADLKELSKQLHDLDREYLIAQKDMEALNEKIIFTREAKKNFIKDQADDINRNERMISEYHARIKESKPLVLSTGVTKKKLDELKEELARLDYASAERVEKEYNLFKKQIRAKELEIKNRKQDIGGYKSSIREVPENCTQCGGALSQRNVKAQVEIIKGTLFNAEKQMKVAESELDELWVAFKHKNKELASIIHRKRNRLELEEPIKKLESELDEAQTLINKIARWEDQITEYQETIKHIKEKKPTFKVKPLLKQKEEMKDQFLKTEALHKDLTTQVEDLKWVVGDVLSNKGLKSYIFDTSLNNLNHRLKYYEQFIGYRVEFKVDFSGANKDIYTVCYKDGHMIYYEDLSGGQKQQVNICTAFALNDMVTQDKPINILVLDEVFENLDERTTDLVYDLITDRAKERSIFLITHNLQLQNTGDKVIRLSLNDKGQSVMKLLAS